MENVNKFVKEYKALCIKYGMVFDVLSYNIYVTIADKNRIEASVKDIVDTTEGLYGLSEVVGMSVDDICHGL